MFVSGHLDDTAWQGNIRPAGKDVACWLRAWATSSRAKLLRLLIFAAVVATADGLLAKMQDLLQFLAL